MIQNAKIREWNVPSEKYHHEPELRGSPKLTIRAHIMAELLWNANRWRDGYESPESKALKTGSLYDCLLLTPAHWKGHYAVVPENAPRKPTKAQRNAKKPSADSLTAIEWWDDFIENNPGEIVTKDENDKVHGALDRLRRDVEISELIACCRRAVWITAEWHDKTTRLVIPLKCLIDLLPPSDHPVYSKAILDLKFVRCAAKRAFESDAMKFRHDIQAGFYEDMHNAATGECRTDFCHVIQENVKPFELRTPPPPMTQRFKDFGKLSYQAALRIYCDALVSGKWPGYERTIGANYTDCSDWFINPDSLYAPIHEPEAESEPEEEADETPAEADLYGAN